MRRRFGFRAASGTLVLAVVGMLAAPVGANPAAAPATGARWLAKPDDPRGDHARIQAELKKTGAVLDGATKRAADAVARHQAAVAALPGAEDRVAQAHGAVVAASAQAATAQRASIEATRLQEAAEEVVRQRSAEVEQARDRLGSFAAAAYTGSAVAEFNMLLEVRSPEEMVQRVGYLQRITDNQRAAIDQARRTRLAARDAANQAELARRAAVEAQRAAESRLAQAQAAEQEAADAEAALVTLVAERKAAAQIADAERDAVLRQYQEQKDESERIAARLRAWEAAQQNRGPTLRPGARLLMPTRGWKSSDFGQRYDPYYHVWQLHAGVDIAAGGGTPIYAAADGVVAYADWAGGYGNYTCLRHGRHNGESMSTCYGHQSRIVVSPGQRVRAGQLIGRVGTTGASTGDHLHFEVRLDGRPVNPLPFLPGCLC